MGSKQIHDAYGKSVLREAFGTAFDDSPKPVSFGNNAGTLKIDGTIGPDIAVEVESRASKDASVINMDILGQLWHALGHANRKTVGVEIDGLIAASG